jgi:hypothetical protein
VGRKGSEMSKVNSLTTKSLFDFHFPYYKIVGNFVDQGKSKKNFMKSIGKENHV